MSRNTKWKLDKTKVKVVFRLQFHATHIPQTGWDKLSISFIPADSGKVTSKTTKANVRNGMCKWGDPIYETTRLLQDSKTKQYDEKLYKIVVGMGSSRASTLGEATVNLADYIDALKPSVLAIPLQGCSFGTTLHITVQLLTSKTGFREFEQQRELRERGFRSGPDSSNSDEITNDQIDKGTAKIKFKTDVNELSSVEEEVNLNEDYIDSNSGAGFEGSSNNSGSPYPEKHENDSFKTNTLSHSQTSSQENSVLAREWDSNHSIHNEYAVACEENSRLRGSLELAETSLFHLKLEVSSLQGIADELGNETQKFSHLLASEVSASQELSKQVSFMKSECHKFKDDVENLRDSKFKSRTMTEKGDHQVLKGIGVAEGKIRELQNKTYVLSHEIDTSLMYSELEALLDILQNVKRGIGQQFVPENGFGLDLCQPGSILQHFEVSNPVGAIDAMKGQIFDLVRELEDAKVEKEVIIQKMHQMDCYYEALVQELEENQKHLLGELQHLRNEHSTCLNTLSASRAEFESMHESMSRQMLKSADERRDLESLNKELGRRATASEAALRRARLNYSIAVDKLQKDLELLSSQVVSMFETNESLIKQTFVETSENDSAEKPSLHQYSNLSTGKRSRGGDVILEDLKQSFCLQEELYRKVEKELMEMYSVNLNLDIYSIALQESLLETNGDVRTMNKKMDELLEELEISTASQNQLMISLQKATEDIQALNEYKSSSISQCSDMAQQNQVLEDKLESISNENHLLVEKLKDWEKMMAEYKSYRSKFEACSAENGELSLLLKQEMLEHEKLQTEILFVKENLVSLKSESDEVVALKRSLEENMNFMQDKLANLLASYNKQFGVLADSHDYAGPCVKDAILQLEEIQQNACSKIDELTKDNLNLESERVVADACLSSARSEVLAMKQKFKSDMESFVGKLDASTALVGKLQSELESLANKLQFSSEIEEKHAEQNKVLLADLALLEDQMHELTCNSAHLSRDIPGLDALAEEFERRKSMISELVDDKQELVTSLQDQTEKSMKLELEIGSLKEDLRNLHEELHKEKANKEELEKKFNDLTSQLNKNKNALVLSLQVKTEEAFKLASEVNLLKEDLRNLHNELKTKNDMLSNFEQHEDELLHIRKLVSDLELEKSRLTNLLEQQNMLVEKLQEEIHDKQEIFTTLRDKTDECVQLTSKIDGLKEDVKNLHDELRKEKAGKDESERKVSDLTSQLNKGKDFLFSFEQKTVELIHATKLASELELEKSNLARLLEQQNSFIEKLQKEICCQANQLFDVLDYSLASEVKLIYLSNQYETLLEELQKRHIDLEAVSNQCFAREAYWNEEKSNLLTIINSLRSDLEVSGAKNKLLLDSNNDIRDQLEGCKRKLKMTENLEEEINSLNISKEELEILVLVLKGKINENCVEIALLEEYKEELTKLRSQCNELSRKLSEQVLKTEEFKNLSTHLKALKDKAEAECREKREEGHTVSSQDSLRVAFIKEQYETKFQELTHQLAISKKYGEEMLLKLQDSIDEIENRKKSEAVNLKRNGELVLKLLDLEKELQSALTEKRERMMAYEGTKAELECALLSLECCKEEKEKLEASLQEFEAEKSGLANELKLLRGELKESKSSVSMLKDEFKLNGSTEKSFCSFIELERSMHDVKREDADPTKDMGLQIVQDTTSGGTHRISEALMIEAPKSNIKNLAVNGDCVGAQMLRSSMEHLQEQLEKMKNENLAVDKDYDSPDFHTSEGQIMQLHKANEELRSMFPSFNEISGGGNALESVLALEMELAEALKAKNKRNIQFQSSFLKQHSNEEAVLKSFRDINELIKEMLELKGKHENVETELREMHERYSQLSLQFAEVEGERQKLKMTLKNVRASRKLVCSSSSDLPTP